MKNKYPRTFQDVRVFAGDNFYPAADASYRNLIWESGVSGVVNRNTEIATIPRWGPWFRVSFDLKINSYRFGNKGGWSSVIAFKKDGGESNLGKIGDRIPAVFLNKKRGSLHFASGVNGKRNHNFDFISIKLKKWFGIVIEQTRDKGKVRESDKKSVNEINLLDLLHGLC